jgi:phosphotransferase system HPr (HPr) family protein
MDTPSVTRAVAIKHAHGLHARPAEMFARTALKFTSQIEVCANRERADGKSILHLLTLGATDGTELVIEATGPDAEQAVDALVKLVETGFSEIRVEE